MLGATKVHQMEENLGAISALERLTDTNMEQIDEIMGNKRDAYEGGADRGGVP